MTLEDKQWSSLSSGITPFGEKTLDFYLQRRSDKKRDYVFSVSTMKTCPHNELTALATGDSKYRCLACNWVFDFPMAKAQSLHNTVVGAALHILHASKEFGMDAVQEMLRTPKGQHELKHHVPVLPEGMSFFDVLEALEEVDVNTPDGGNKALRGLLEGRWVSLAERERRGKEVAGMGQVPELGEGNGTDSRHRLSGGAADKKNHRRRRVPSLPEKEGAGPARGSP